MTVLEGRGVGGVDRLEGRDGLIFITRRANSGNECMS